MTITEKIVKHVESLPESLQAEVLDFVEYLETKKGGDEIDWSAFSLSNAMHGMENERSPYSLNDLKESFS
tara:strand:- start:342 stop:551 length:210 start_codon:yes stop_codon:yes gene_type:complete